MPRTKSDSFNRKVTFYDENFDLKSTPVSGKFDDPKTYVDALAKFGNDETKVLEALTTFLRQKTIADKMSEVSGGMEEKYILAFIRPMRQMSPFNVSETLHPDGKEIGTNKAGEIDEKRQTAAILKQVKTVPFLLEGLKSYCKNRAEEGDESED